MAQMSGTSVIDTLLEIVEKITITEDSSSIQFSKHGNGLYIVVGYPIMNSDRAIAAGQSKQLFQSSDFLVYNNIIRQGNTASFKTNGGLDYWGSGASISEDILTLTPSAQNVMFLAGDYYVLKPKE